MIKYCTTDTFIGHLNEFIEFHLYLTTGNVTQDKFQSNWNQKLYRAFLRKVLVGCNKVMTKISFHFSAYLVSLAAKQIIFGSSVFR